MNNLKRTATHTFMYMAALTLISKLLGFVREMVMANFYGTSYIVDAYVMATTIPGIIFGGIFGAVATAYMPTYSRLNRKDGEIQSNKFTSQVINIIVILSIIASLVGIFLSDQIVQIFASGFEGETSKLTSFFVKITFSYVIFTASGNILDSYLNYKGIFLKPIISGYFLNFAMIAVIIISSFSTHYILAFGILIGAGLRLVYLFIVSTKAGYKYIPSFSFNKPVRNIIGLAIPVFIGTYINEINVFVDKTLASRLPEGSVAALNYGMILVGLFTGLTVTLIIKMIYPRITKASAHEDWADFNDVIEKGMNLIIIISVPISFGIIAFNEEVVQIVYERGAFDTFATSITAGAFFYYGIGLVFFSLNALFVKIFYSLHNTKVSIICAGLSVIINVSLDFLLIGPMAQRGLALATSVAALTNTLMLYYWIKHKYPQIRIMKSKRKMIKIIFSAAAAVGLAYLTNWTLVSNIWMPRMMYLGSSVMVAVIVYYLLLRVFKIDETKLISQIFRKPGFK